MEVCSTGFIMAVIGMTTKSKYSSAPVWASTSVRRVAAIIGMKLRALIVVRAVSLGDIKLFLSCSFSFCSLSGNKT